MLSGSCPPLLCRSGFLKTTAFNCYYFFSTEAKGKARNTAKGSGFGTNYLNPGMAWHQHQFLRFFLKGSLAASFWNLDFVFAGIASDLFLQSCPRGHFLLEPGLILIQRD